MRIESKAPTRIDLAGGTLDIWPLYLFHEGALTVNCAISRYASCVIEPAPQNSPRITLASRDANRKESFASWDALCRAHRYKLPLLAQLVKVFRPAAGFSMTTDSEAPAGAGIGGSSALAVAICAALDKLTEAGLRREEWIHISRDVEAIVIRVPTGTQDHYPPAFGGASAIVLSPGGERREPLRCDLDELERRLILCYTGKPRRHGINNWEVFQRHIDGDKRVAQNLEKISIIARAVRDALDRNEWNEAGRLVREEWEFRRGNLRTISTPLIDRVISSARRNGALGGKVCGAGGGGCVTLVIDPDARARVEAAVVAAGAKLLPFRIDRDGVSLQTGPGPAPKTAKHAAPRMVLKCSGRWRMDRLASTLAAVALLFSADASGVLRPPAPAPLPVFPTSESPHAQTGAQQAPQTSAPTPSDTPAKPDHSKKAPSGPLRPETRLTLVRYVDGELVRVVRSIPAGKKGFHLKAGVPLDEKSLRMALASSGSAINPGDRAQITSLEFKEKQIVLDINGGGKGRTHLRDHIQLEVGGAVPVMTTSTPSGSVNPSGGATLYLDFEKPLPDMTPEELEKYLSGVLDFSKRHSAAVQWVETLPPEIQQAIEEKKPAVGMDREMVLAALGRPDRKVREKGADGAEVEDWIYGTPPEKTIFVSFEGDKVTQVRQYPQ